MSELHPLRIAYLRTLQAIIAVHIVRVEIDSALGGHERFLNEIEESLGNARDGITRLAVAEHIDLVGEDE